MKSKAIRVKLSSYHYPAAAPIDMTCHPAEAAERSIHLSQSISRVLSWAIIYLGCLSPNTSCSLPKLSAGRTIEFLFGLAPSGVYLAATVTSNAVRSYRTISPLPQAARFRALPRYALNRDNETRLFRERGRYIFCGTFRKLTLPRCYLALCPAGPGLSSLLKKSDCLTDSLAIVAQIFYFNLIKLSPILFKNSLANSLEILCFLY